MKEKRPSGFTLVELLAALAIIAVLAAILVPTVSRVRETARQAAAASNAREIVKAALLFAHEHDGRLPPSRIGPAGQVFGPAADTDATLATWAAALARSGILNDAALFIAPGDPQTAANARLSTILNATGTPEAAFADASTVHSFQVVSGLNTGDPASTPVVFTRGLASTGEWSAEHGVYGASGGHIAFLGGHVRFFDHLGDTDADGRLSHRDGGPTRNILHALPLRTGATGVRILTTGSPPLADGTGPAE